MAKTFAEVDAKSVQELRQYRDDWAIYEAFDQTGDARRWQAIDTLLRELDYREAWDGNEIDHLKAVVKDKTEDVDFKDNQISSIVKNHQAYKSSAERTINSLNDKVERWQKIAYDHEEVLTVKDDEIRGLRRQRDNLHGLCAALRLDKDYLVSENARLQDFEDCTLVSQLEGAKIVSARRIMTIEEMTRKIDGLNEYIGHLEARITDAREILQEDSDPGGDDQDRLVSEDEWEEGT